MPRAKPSGSATATAMPKPVMTELGVQTGDTVTLTLENGRVILTPEKAHPRTGWAEAARAIAAAGDEQFMLLGDLQITFAHHGGMFRVKTFDAIHARIHERGNDLIRAI